MEWPEEALEGVARGFLTDMQEEENEKSQRNKEESEDYKEKIIEFFKFSQKFLEEESKRYLVELNRHNHITPKSYLELLKTYKVIL